VLPLVSVLSLVVVVVPALLVLFEPSEVVPVVFPDELVPAEDVSSGVLDDDPQAVKDKASNKVVVLRIIFILKRAREGSVAYYAYKGRDCFGNNYHIATPSRV